MEQTIRTVTEVLRMPSPAPRPQSLAFDGETLWMGSIETCRLYAIDPIHWTVREECEAPGQPYGLTVMGDELRVLLAENNDERRVIRRYVPGHGFKNEGAIDCPDNTGSQLGFDGDRLYVSQWYNKRVISLDADGRTGTVIESPHGICGQVIVQGAFYLLGTDDEESGDYIVTRIDARDGRSHSQDLARVDFPGRALAYDSSHNRYWSNHREAHEIVAFTID